MSDLYRHVLWDFDGTLMDTYPAITRAYSLALQEAGVHEAEEEIAQRMQVRMDLAAQHYEAKHGLPPSVAQRFAELRAQLEPVMCLPFPGAYAVCEAVARSGRFNYLYTHRAESSLAMLKAHGFLGFFTDFVTGEPQFHRFARKPEPDAILYLKEKHAMRGEDAVMIGDRDIDLLAAKRAGIAACYFRPGAAANPIADFTVASLWELQEFL